MKKFKIINQRIFFGGNEIITDKNITQEKIFDCDSYSLDKDEVEITDQNIEFAKKNINESYNIGDIHYSPLKFVSFFRDDTKIEKINVFADPYYKLYEFVDGEWKLLDKHECGK